MKHVTTRVGQDGILRGGCLPALPLVLQRAGPIANRPQLARLPHKVQHLNNNYLGIL